MDLLFFTQINIFRLYLCITTYVIRAIINRRNIFVFKYILKISRSGFGKYYNETTDNKYQGRIQLS